MLAIARALVASPGATARRAVDGTCAEIRRPIFDIIANERARGTPFCSSSRTPRKALAVADRAYVLERGASPRGDRRDLMRDPL